MPSIRRARAGGGRTRRAASKPPRLVLRFAVVTAIGLAIATAGILVFVRHHATAQAERAVAFHARFVADAILRDRLRPSDFAAPPQSKRRAELDELFRRRVLVGGPVRLRLLTPDGRVTYSNDGSLIGTTAPDAPQVRRALRGSLVTDVASVTTKGRESKVLAAYVPVRFGGSRPAGVFELSQDYAPIARSVRKVFLPVAAVLQVVLLALYISLFPLLHGVTKTLRRQMREIEHQAIHDDLTSLPNRAHFRERVGQALLAAKSAGRGVTVMLIDLDRFKEVNDTLGHESGDRLLQELGARLRTLFRSDDTVARLGGDEFGVISPGAGDARTAHMLAERIRRAIAEPFVISGLTLAVEASVGIALYPKHGDDVETLMRHADVAMYESKRSHTATIYAHEDDHHSHDRLALVAELRSALENRELVLHYQPCVDVATGDVRRVEALVRWEHPARGLLSPDDFVPVAEQTGLIRPLTGYVLDAALSQCRAWQDDGLELAVSVNLSGRDILDVGLPDEVASALAKHGLEPRHLELEISENAILADPGRAQDVLRALRQRNVSLAIDDFGTGSSSLTHLKRFPVDVMKIDRSFVAGMETDEDDAVIVRSTIDLGHNLGLAVVAEGVDSEEVWKRLLALGCDGAQGSAVGRPMTAAELSSWLLDVDGARAARVRAGKRRKGRKVVPLAAAKAKRGSSASAAS